MLEDISKEIEKAIDNFFLELIENSNPFKDLTEEELKELESEDKDYEKENY